MKLDKRTRDALCAIAMGVLLGIIVFLLQRRFFNKEGYEGEEGEEKPDESEKLTEGEGEANEEPDETEEVIEELVAESQDVGEEEIDEFDEELKAAQNATDDDEDLSLPTSEEMDAEIAEDATKEELITALSAALDEGSIKVNKKSSLPKPAPVEETKKEDEDIESTGDKIAKMAQDALLGEIMKVAAE